VHFEKPSVERIVIPVHKNCISMHTTQRDCNLFVRFSISLLRQDIIDTPQFLIVVKPTFPCHVMSHDSVEMFSEIRVETEL
jgi:hypothetical protein